SGSGTATLTFDYTVVSGDNTAALDYGALTLNSGTIKDAQGNNANLSLFIAGSLAPLSISITTSPQIGVIAPQVGLPSGGTVVTITGVNLTGAIVKFGTVTGTTTASALTSLTVTAPAHATGTVDVFVQSIGGTGTVLHGFTFDAPPVLTSTVTISTTDGLTG